MPRTLMRIPTRLRLALTLATHPKHGREIIRLRVANAALRKAVNNGFQKTADWASLAAQNAVKAGKAEAEAAHLRAEHERLLEQLELANTDMASMEAETHRATRSADFHRQRAENLELEVARLRASGSSAPEDDAEDLTAEAAVLARLAEATARDGSPLAAAREVFVSADGDVFHGWVLDATDAWHEAPRNEHGAIPLDEHISYMLAKVAPAIVEHARRTTRALEGAAR
ncbi:hypothetical protein ACQP25_44650 (plasmid) [Microtetraspora malaysiensis]|uniref:hypothetical protein n=1 Tax=Microtetraspora malaysiensis TaxID=161358 RepID=UPI003D8DDE3B